LVVATGGSSVVVNQIGANDINGTYTLIDYNSTTAALATSFTSVTGPAGHTYSISIDTPNTQVLLNITAAGAGSGSELAGGSVPEPATIVFVAMAIGAFATGRRRRS
jgi:hypothetical protein